MLVLAVVHSTVFFNHFVAKEHKTASLLLFSQCLCGNKFRNNEIEKESQRTIVQFKIVFPCIFFIFVSVN